MITDHRGEQMPADCIALAEALGCNSDSLQPVALGNLSSPKVRIAKIRPQAT
jgi:hypothetical protein